METIKSYSDLQQSKKLSEILPLESADMYLWSSGKRYYIEAMDDGDFNEEEGHVRAWSLSALLGVLPDIHLKKYIYDGITKYYTTLVGIKQFNSEHYDNPVDACVAMIEKLHELKML